jgi:putative transposase
VIRDEKDFFEHADYIHSNPVKAGLVTAATDYPWSSAAFWETGEGIVTCDGLRWE